MEKIKYYAALSGEGIVWYTKEEWLKIFGYLPDDKNNLFIEF